MVVFPPRTRRSSVWTLAWTRGRDRQRRSDCFLSAPVFRSGTACGSWRGPEARTCRGEQISTTPRIAGNAVGRAGLSPMSGNQRFNLMRSVKTLATAAAFVLVLAGHAVAQSMPGRSSIDATPDGGAVDSSRGAVNSARGAVNAAPSAVERAPSAVERAPSAVEQAGGKSSTDASSNLQSRTSSDTATSAR